MRNKSFLNGALILAAAGIISKFIGFFFKVPLTSLIGAKGLGLYNYPYNLYSAMLAFSISGLPVAISKMVSERIAINKREAANNVLKVALLLMSLVGVLTSIILFIGSKIIVNKFWPPGAYYPLMGLVFAPIFVAPMSVFRGYFQGLQMMTPTAISQIFESFGRLIVGLGLAYLFVDRGIEYAAGGASFGSTAGTVLGLIVLIIAYIVNKRKNNTSLKSKEKKESNIFIIKQILIISIPISIGALASSMMSLIDSLMINSRLAVAGFSVEESAVLYGQLGAANTLINFPLSISIAIAASIVPVIAQAKAQRNKKEIRDKSEEGIKMGFYIVLPAMMGLYILAEPILTLIFPTIKGGGEVLKLLSVALIFITINQVLTGALQGLGKVMNPVKNLLLGSLIKIVISYYLTIQPSYNIKGAAIGTIIGYAIASILNYIDLKKHTKLRIKVSDVVVKPLLAAIAMSIAVYFGFNYLSTIFNSNTIGTLLSVIIGAVVYSIVIIIVGGVNIKDISNILNRKRK